MRAPVHLLALSVALGSFLVTASVRAESAVYRPDLAPPCTPADLETEPAAGDVPANWPIFTFVGGDGRGLDWSTVRLVRVSDGAAVPLAAPLVAPLARLVVGEDYDLYHPICPGETPSVTRYRAVAPIAEPLTLGTIEVSELYAANYYQGVANRGYFVEVRLYADPGFDAAPWSTLVAWDSEIDGDASSPTSSPRHVHLRLPVDCGAGYGIAPGDRVFRGVGFVVPGSVRFSTPYVSSTVGPCATALRVDNTTLRPLTPEEILYWDSAPMDAAVPTMDGGIGGALDGGRVSMLTEPDTNSNCAIGPGRSGRFGLSAVVSVALCAVWRRRRRAPKFRRD